MSTPSIQPGTADTHVEAFCSTGTSPGRTVTVELNLDHHGPTRVSVAYEVQGPPHAPAVVVLGGISAGRHVSPSPLHPEAGWWPGVVGPGAPVDTHRHRIVGIDWLGGAESPWIPRAPLTPLDQARAVCAVLDHLDIERAALVGASYGGMVALALAAAWPERVSRAAVLCAAHRPHPHATAVRAVQRRILGLAGGSPDVVALARALAMTTYRTPQEFDGRFDRRAEQAAGDPAGLDARRVRFPVESYLDARGADFARRFDARAFDALSTSIDLQDVDPVRITTPTLLVSVSSDTLAPPWLVAELAGRVAGPVRHMTLDSVYGHDAFLKEVHAVGGLVSAFLVAPGVPTVSEGDREVAR